jgi:hypothetical protein
MEVILSSLKVCSFCNVSRVYSDYVNSSDECYKCVYARKVAHIEMRSSGRTRKICKICELPLPDQRWTYCGDECAAEGKRLNKHWTLVLSQNHSEQPKKFDNTAANNKKTRKRKYRYIF